MKCELAKARDKWFVSDDGKECCEGQTSGKYLQNRLERAFLAGANFSSERIKELKKCLEEEVLLKTADVIAYERSRIQVSTRLIEMIDDIRKDVEQALKGGG